MSLDNTSTDYSIVICTYNPDKRILQRCLTAVSRLHRRGLITETILIDNNSEIPVSGLPYLKEFFGTIEGLKIIVVPNQGLVHARVAAIEAARGHHVVFVDSDNEPAENYLHKLQELQTEYPQVAAWGPGNIWVDFIDGVEQKIETYAKAAFQERHEQATLFASIPEWQPCYPFGTGLCVSKSMLLHYNQMVKEQKLTLSGRKGNLLSSGDDTQMILLCISKGGAAGVSPELHVNHIIPANRANNNYLKRLAFGTSISYETCLLQIFPARKNVLLKSILPPPKFIRKALKKFAAAKLSGNPNSIFQMIAFLGANAGIYLALNKPMPKLIQRLIKLLKLD